MTCPDDQQMVIGVMSKQHRAQKGSAKSFKAVEGQLLTEEQIKLFIEFFNKHNTIPGNKIVCNATGKLTTCVGPWKDKKIKEYGGVENLLRNYKRREATPTKVVTKAQEVATEEADYKLPILKYETKPLTSEQLTQETKSACIRPDIYLTNGKHCDGCAYYGLCQSHLKKLPKYAKAA